MPVSRTFHGRDVFAPIAAALAAGVDPATVGRRVRSLVQVKPPTVHRRGRTLVGEVLWADVFGNLATNVMAAHLHAAGFRGNRLSTTIAGHVVPIRSSYASVAPGRPVALVNSADLLEIAVNQGSAAARFAAGPGTTISVASHRTT